MPTGMHETPGTQRAMVTRNQKSLNRAKALPSGICGASCPNMGWASESTPMCAATLEAEPVGGTPTAPGMLHMPDEMLSPRLLYKTLGKGSVEKKVAQ